MHLLLALAYVAVGAFSNGTEPAQIPHNYLRGAEMRQCDAPHRDDEIVVCGRANDADRDRLNKPDSDRYAAKPLRAEVGLGGGIMLKAAAADTVLMPGELRSAPDQPSVKYYKEPRLTLIIPFQVVPR